MAEAKGGRQVNPVSEMENWKVFCPTRALLASSPELSLYELACSVAILLAVATSGSHQKQGNLD
jgi:hypothetical protein